MGSCKLRGSLASFSAGRPTTRHRPDSFFVPLLTCASYLPGSADNANSAGFCDPHIDRAIKHAQSEQTANPEAAGRLWQRVDREILDQAPWVPLSSPNLLNVLSKRVGNFLFSPMRPMLIDQLWVRQVPQPLETEAGRAASQPTSLALSPPPPAFSTRRRHPSDAAPWMQFARGASPVQAQRFLGHPSRPVRPLVAVQEA